MTGEWDREIHETVDWLLEMAESDHPELPRIEAARLVLLGSTRLKNEREAQVVRARAAAVLTGILRESRDTELQMKAARALIVPTETDRSTETM